MQLSSQCMAPSTGQFKYHPREGAQHTPVSVEREQNDFNFLFGTVQEDEIMATLLGPESPWMGGKKRTRNRNILSRIRQSQITGGGFSRGTQVNGRVCAADTEKPLSGICGYGLNRRTTCFKLRNNIHRTGVALNLNLEVV